MTYKEGYFTILLFYYYRDMNIVKELLFSELSQEAFEENAEYNRLKFLNQKLDNQFFLYENYLDENFDKDIKGSYYDDISNSVEFARLIEESYITEAKILTSIKNGIMWVVNKLTEFLHFLVNKLEKTRAQSAELDYSKINSEETNNTSSDEVIDTKTEETIDSKIISLLNKCNKFKPTMKELDTDAVKVWKDRLPNESDDLINRLSLIDASFIDITPVPIKNNEDYGAIDITDLADVLTPLTKDSQISNNAISDVKNTLKSKYSKCQQQGYIRLDTNSDTLRGIVKSLEHLKKKIEHTFARYGENIQENYNTDVIYYNILLEKANKKHNTKSKKKDFRTVFDANTGHLLRIIYSLDNIKIEDVGLNFIKTPEFQKEFKKKYPNERPGYFDPTNKKYHQFVEEYRKKLIERAQKNINKTGNLDHSSSGQHVVAIEDLKTRNYLKQADTLSLVEVKKFGIDTNKIALSDDEFHVIREAINRNLINVYKVKVGDVDKVALYKSTTVYNKTKNRNPNVDAPEDFDAQASKQFIQEPYPEAKGVKARNIDVSRSDNDFENSFFIYHNPNLDQAINELKYVKKYCDNIIATVGQLTNEKDKELYNNVIKDLKELKNIKRDQQSKKAEARRWRKNGKKGSKYTKKYKSYDIHIMDKYRDVFSYNPTNTSDRQYKKRAANIADSLRQSLSIFKRVLALNITIYNEYTTFCNSALNTISGTT